MKRRDLITEQGGWGVYVSLLLLCGVALVFSMPWATRVRELIASPWQPSPLVFFSVYALLAAIVGLNRGAALAPRGVLQWRPLLKVAAQIGFAHFLLMPYLVYVRVLLPGLEMRIPILAAYTLLVSAVLGLAAHCLESWRSARGETSSGLRYGVLFGLFCLPLLAAFGGERFGSMVPLSPFGVVYRLLTESAGADLPIAFGFPAAVGLALLVYIGFRARRWRR